MCCRVVSDICINAYKRSHSSQILKILNDLGRENRTKHLCKSGGFLSHIQPYLRYGTSFFCLFFVNY